MKPGEIEQSNCVARREHSKLTGEQRCAQCGYPGEYTGKVVEAVRVLKGAAGSLEEAVDHIKALLALTAATNANDLPMESGACTICDLQAEHPGTGMCGCVCHPARAFVEAMEGGAHDQPQSTRAA